MPHTGMAPFFLERGDVMTELKPIKQVIKENHVYQWQIAEVLGIREQAFSTILRHEPDAEMRQRILDAIQQLKQ